MRKSQFTEAQIVGIIKESEAGVNTAALCRRNNISTTTFYKWKSKFGGMEVSDVAKMRALEVAVSIICSHEGLRAVTATNNDDFRVPLQCM